MSNIVIVGGGFGGVVAAESLAKRLGDEHQITLVSRTRKFIFYPALVRLAFGKCEHNDVQFDIRDAMTDRRIRFVEGEVARIHSSERLITLAYGDFIGNMPYDYLVLALGRRLKTEMVEGFYEHGHHILSVSDARKFGEAIEAFHKGRAIIGACPGARLPVPVFETAFALSHRLKERNERERCQITVLSNETLDEMFGGVPISDRLHDELRANNIELISGFPITALDANSVFGSDGRRFSYDLNMIIPPFGGPGPLVSTGLVDSEGYAEVDESMRVRGVERVYAVGDCTSLPGPKMGHMAVRQAVVAAENLAAEIQGKPLPARYDHEMMLVIDAGGNESTFVHKDLFGDGPANIQRSRFWGWAKRRQEQYWKARHA